MNQEKKDKNISYGKKPCMSREHNPPANLYVPQGQEFIHVCPVCGAETVLSNNLINLN